MLAPLPGQFLSAEAGRQRTCSSSSRSRWATSSASSSCCRRCSFRSCSLRMLTTACQPFLGSRRTAPHKLLPHFMLSGHPMCLWTLPTAMAISVLDSRQHTAKAKTTMLGGYSARRTPLTVVSPSEPRCTAAQPSRHARHSTYTHSGSFRASREGWCVRAPVKFGAPDEVALIVEHGCFGCQADRQQSSSQVQQHHACMQRQVTQGQVCCTLHD